MIVCALAAPLDCRNGNCPTVWDTDAGTLVVQGYLLRRGAVAVPSDVLRRAAVMIIDRARAWNGPTFGAAALATTGMYTVQGRHETPDVLDLQVPPGEGAVEVSPDVLLGVRGRDAIEEAA